MRTVFGNLMVNTLFEMNNVKYIKASRRMAYRCDNPSSRYYIGLDEPVVKPVVLPSDSRYH